MTQDQREPAAPGVSLLREALDLSKYAAAPFFSTAERRRDEAGDVYYVQPTTEEWWTGLRDLIEAIQPKLTAALSSPPSAPGGASLREPNALRDNVLGILRRWNKDNDYDLDTCIRDLRALLAARPAEGVWEALQRLIEDGVSAGKTRAEDAVLVAKYRRHLLSAAPSVRATEPAFRLVRYEQINLATGARTPFNDPPPFKAGHEWIALYTDGKVNR